MKKKISKIYFNFFSWDFIIYTQHTSKFGIMLKSTPLLICSLKYYFKILFVQSKFEYVQKKNRIYGIHSFRCQKFYISTELKHPNHRLSSLGEFGNASYFYLWQLTESMLWTAFFLPKTQLGVTNAGVLIFQI